MTCKVVDDKEEKEKSKYFQMKLGTQLADLLWWTVLEAGLRAAWAAWASGRGSSVARWGSRGRWSAVWWLSRVAESRWMEDSVREDVACSVSVSDCRESYSSLSLRGPPAPRPRLPLRPWLFLGVGRLG